MSELFVEPALISDPAVGRVVLAVVIAAGRPFAADHQLRGLLRVALPS